MGIDYVDGRRFRRAVEAGADWVLHTRETLNRLNVYPVPDGDTGTNMALSLSATAGAVRDIEERRISEMSRRVAEASVLGAKGNSGLILAHWFLGLSLGLVERRRIGSPELANAMDRATRAVYDALEDPVEGTIITVMRSASAAALASAEAGHDVELLLDEVIVAAEKTLAETPEMLRVLKEAQVVDAGAQGYVNFMKGVRRVIRGEPPPDYSTLDLGAADIHPEPAPGEEITERFCTEVICRGRGFDADDLRQRFRADGTHLIVATTGEVFKMHIHTNHPEEVLRKAAKLGDIEERKVDDMLRQRDERETGPIAPIVPLADQPAGTAILCDSTADLSEDLRREHGIEMVPLQVLFGDAVFRDQVDLGTNEFYDRLEGGERPTTSQPPPREFVEALERIRSDREAIVLTLSAQLSGTHRSAVSGVRLASNPRVEIIDSGSASLGLGMIAIGASRLAARGMPTDEILGWVDTWKRSTSIVLTVATLEYLRRGGRIGAAKSMIGNMLGLRPVLVFTDGVLAATGKARGEIGSMNEVIAEVGRRLPTGTRIRLGLVSARRSDLLDMIEERLRDRYEVVESFRGEKTGVLGAHTGPGSWGVIWHVVPDGDPLAD